MSFQAMDWASRHKCANSGQKLVLLMLANCANHHTSQCNPSHQRLADECCMGVSTLKGHLLALAESGAIKIVSRSFEGRSLPNHYALMIDERNGGGGQNLTGEGSGSDRGRGQDLATEPGIKNLEENQEDAPRKRSARQASPASIVSIDVLIQDGLTEEVAQAWITHRKRKRADLTDLAWKGIKAEAEKAGWPIQAAVEKALARGWQSFDAAFVEREKPAGASKFAGVL